MKAVQAKGKSAKKTTRGTRAAPTSAKGAASAGSKDVDARIQALPGWQRGIMSRVRDLVKQAVPDVEEDVKWRKPSNAMAGVPVWSRDGMILTGEPYKGYVKLTFVYGAAFEDPKGLFNAGFGGGTRRAIDLRQGEAVDEAAFMDLVREAVERNQSAR